MFGVANSLQYHRLSLIEANRLDLSSNKNGKPAVETRRACKQILYDYLGCYLLNFLALKPILLEVNPLPDPGYLAKAPQQTRYIP